MPWVRFTAGFDFKPKPAVTQAFRAGEEKFVTTECARQAMAADKAVRIKKPEGAGARK